MMHPTDESATSRLVAPTDLVQALGSADRVLITSHANPDGDAIGSETALALGLMALGKEVLVWNHDPTPSNYEGFVGQVPWSVSATPPPSPFDVHFFVECPTPERTGHSTHPAVPLRINVDHHLGNTNYADHNWVIPTAASVSILIHEVLHALGVDVDAPMADALLLGLTTDTGGFRFSNTTADAHQAAAAMIVAGASPERISQRIYESRTTGSVRLLGEVLQTLELRFDGRVASITLTHDHLLRAEASRQDTEGLIDYPRSIEGVEIAVLFRELEGADRFKVSLRSRGTTSVETIARRHGGGGHRNAAGCELPGPLESARETLFSDLQGALSQESHP